MTHIAPLSRGAFFFGLRMLNDSYIALPPYYKEAANRLPQSEVTYLRECLSQRLEEKTPSHEERLEERLPSDIEVRLMIAVLRCSNRICEECGTKEGRLFPCLGCYSLHYCSEECQRQHATVGGHASRCCKERELGYSATYMV